MNDLTKLANAVHDAKTDREGFLAGRALADAILTGSGERPDTDKLAIDIEDLLIDHAGMGGTAALTDRILALIDAHPAPAASPAGDERLEPLTDKETDELLNLRTFRDHGGLTPAGNRRLAELAARPASPVDGEDRLDHLSGFDF